MTKKIIKKILQKLKALLGGAVWYFQDLSKYRQLLRLAGNKEKIKYFPQIFDRDAASHTFDKHYVYMDRWAFKKLLENRPTEHIDVGSSIRFLSMASAIVKLKFVDIRPIKIDFSNFECIEGSILKMPFPDSSITSISCLHVAEHIGLGRYGDPLDPLGTEKACAELSRILAVGGRLYFALPIGKSAVYFNAHRVHDPQTILKYFAALKLVSFSAIGDDGHFIENANILNYQTANYACGCFEFTKGL